MTKRKTWRCFFCDEVFIDRDKAALHFGVDESCEADEVACKMLSKPRETIVKYIRDCEAEIRRLQDAQNEETHPLLNAVFDAEYNISNAVKEAEERGYAKGITDMMKQGYCVEPNKHVVNS